MPEPVSPSRIHAAAEHTVVVLLLPELLDGHIDPEQWRRTLVGSPTPARVLLCLTRAMEPSLAATLAGLGVETQILLASEVEAPGLAALIQRAPPGTSAADQTEFALALADVVLVGSSSEQNLAIRTAAEKLGKRMIAPGDPLPTLGIYTVARRLDPDLPGWPRLTRARSVFGRLEQAIWSCSPTIGSDARKAASKRAASACEDALAGDGGQVPTFAPGSWPELAPDRSACDQSSKIVACFDALDRSALYGSHIHRDFIWLEHLLAAFAVFAAVAGHVWHADAWGFAELVMLALVALLVVVARSTDLQDRWTACRLAAEQLRIARMALPLFALPPALITDDRSPTGDGRSSKGAEWGALALAEAKRIARDQGLPQLDPALSPAQAADWLRLIVDDQILYHQSNHRKLERAELRLRRSAQAIFLVAVVSVIAHFRFEFDWLLLFTAAGPAFAAALHGAGTRLGIVHRAALSIDAERELALIAGALDRVRMSPLATVEQSWREVRRLAGAAAEAMGRENTSWHGLVRRYEHDV